MIEENFKNSYVHNTAAVTLTASTYGVLGHTITCFSREQAWLQFQTAITGYGGVGNNVSLKVNMENLRTSWYFKNNDQTANDLIIWRLKAKTDIPARQVMDGVLTQYVDVKTWIQALALQQQDYVDTGYTAGADVLMNQYDFKPSDIWALKRYFHISKTKCIGMKPGQRHSEKIYVGSFRGAWKDKHMNSLLGTATAVPAPAANGADADHLLYKGDTLMWVCLRGTIGNVGNLNTPAWSTSSIMRAHMDLVACTRVKLAFAPYQYATNASDNANTLSTSQVYAVQDAVGIYST